jgi:hypothetical protein
MAFLLDAGQASTAADNEALHARFNLGPIAAFGP